MLLNIIRSYTPTDEWNFIHFDVENQVSTNSNCRLIDITLSKEEEKRNRRFNLEQFRKACITLIQEISACNRIDEHFNSVINTITTNNNIQYEFESSKFNAVSSAL